MEIFYGPWVKSLGSSASSRVFGRDVGGMKPQTQANEIPTEAGVFPSLSSMVLYCYWHLALPHFLPPVVSCLASLLNNLSKGTAPTGCCVYHPSCKVAVSADAVQPWLEEIKGRKTSGYKGHGGRRNLFQKFRTNWLSNRHISTSFIHKLGHKKGVIFFYGGCTLITFNVFFLFFYPPLQTIFYLELPLHTCI